MSFNVYFEKEGGLWVEPVEDTDHVKFNFIQVDNKEEYLALTSLMKAKQKKMLTTLKKAVDKRIASIAQLD